MSYISKKLRTSIDNYPIGLAPLRNGRELSYAIMRLCENALHVKETRITHNEILGAFERAKQEYYRKHIQPFEIQEHFDNGEIE